MKKKVERSRSSSSTPDTFSIWLRDERLEGSGWREALESAFGADLQPPKGVRPPRLSESKRLENTIVFLHGGLTQTNLKKWSEVLAPKQGSHLVLVASQGHVPVTFARHEEGIHTCLWTPRDFRLETRRPVIDKLIAEVRANPAGDWWKNLRQRSGGKLHLLQMAMHSTPSPETWLTLLQKKDRNVSEAIDELMKETDDETFGLALYHFLTPCWRDGIAPEPQAIDTFQKQLANEIAAIEKGVALPDPKR